MEAFSDLPTYTSPLDFIAKGGQHSLKTQDKGTNSKISFWGKFINFLYTQNLDRIMGGKKEDSNIREKSVDYISLYFLIYLRL